MYNIIILHIIPTLIIGILCKFFFINTRPTVFSILAKHYYFKIYNNRFWVLKVTLIPAES